MHGAAFEHDDVRISGIDRIECAEPDARGLADIDRTRVGQRQLRARLRERDRRRLVGKIDPPDDRVRRRTGAELILHGSRNARELLVTVARRVERGAEREHR